MNADTIFVLALTAVSVGSVVWLSIHSRPQPADQEHGGATGGAVGSAAVTQGRDQNHVKQDG